MFNRDTLYDFIWTTLEEELGDCTKTDYLTDRICDAVSEWVPKRGDFWLNKDDGRLYVNKGWGDVLTEGGTVKQLPDDSALQIMAQVAVTSALENQGEAYKTFARLLYQYLTDTGPNVSLYDETETATDP